MESGLGELAAHFENNGMLVGCHWSPFKFPKNHNFTPCVEFRHSAQYAAEPLLRPYVPL